MELEGAAEAVETRLVLGEFASGLREGLAALTPLLDLSRASTSLIELEPFSREAVAPKHRVAMAAIQCLFELGKEAEDAELRTLERFLKQNGPLPFPLAATWINFRASQGHLEYAKEILERLLDKFAERTKTGGVVTPEMRSQYGVLAELYAVDVLPGLGEASASQRFLAVHSSDGLLSRDASQTLLHRLDERIGRQRRASDAGSAAAAAATPTAPATATPGAGAAAQTPTGSAGAAAAVSTAPASSTSSSTSSSSSKAADQHTDAALVLTREQVGYLGAGVALLLLATAQRQRLARLGSRFTTGLGNLLFQGERP